jgi:hypothetical protein
MTFEEWARKNIKCPGAYLWTRDDAESAYIAGIDSVNKLPLRAMFDAGAEQGLQEASVTAPWLSLAHIICTDQGIPQGHITERLEQLRNKLQDDLR